MDYQLKNLGTMVLRTTSSQLLGLRILVSLYVVTSSFLRPLTFPAVI
jgi:hypothetical protein